MAKEWIEGLAAEIRSKNRGAAEEYGRAQHFAAIVEEQGGRFFTALIACLREDVDEFRRRLQGDPTAAEMEVQQVNASEIKVSRARFPWVDARLIHRQDTVVLDYAKAPGATGDPSDRQSHIFALKASAQDELYAEDAFANQAARFTNAEELAQRVMTILFAI